MKIKNYPLKTGPKPNFKTDAKVYELRTVAQLSFREIGRVTGEDVKTVHRRWKRVLAVQKTPTE